MNVLITGGAGFIGSHLADRLIARGDRVQVVDDLSTGCIANLDGVIGNPRFTYRIGSVTDAHLMAEAVDRADYVVHLAAAVGVKLIVERPTYTIETNVHGTEVVLNCAAKKQKPVLIASTSEVYGKNTKLPYAEDDDLRLGPTSHSRWAYACSKALDEWLGLAYFREKRVPVTICRFFNTVGPRQTGHYGMVLPSFAGQAVRNAPITVYGTGEQMRCFVHVNDAVEGVLRLMGEPTAAGEVFNIGTNREVTINELARIVREAAGSSSEIVHIPYEKAYAPGFEDMMQRMPDTRKLARFTGFTPSTTLEQIVADVVAYQRAGLKAA